jgi:hypothetical protein
MSSEWRWVRRAKFIAVVAVASSTLSGCATVGQQVRYGSLESKTELSESVFLDPTNDLPRTVYVTESYTAEQPVSVREALRTALVSRGYTVVAAPRDATYIVQVNHRQLVEHELGDGQDLGDAIASAWTSGASAALAAEIFGAGGIAGEVGLAVGVIGFLLDARTRHIAHTLTTDVQVIEKRGVPGGEATREHPTQIVAAASKVNLGRDEAMPALIAGVTRAVTGLLPAVEEPEAEWREASPSATEGGEPPRR